MIYSFLYFLVLKPQGDPQKIHLFPGNIDFFYVPKDIRFYTLELRNEMQAL